jgi:hypothetical protein
MLPVWSPDSQQIAYIIPFGRARQPLFVIPAFGADAPALPLTFDDISTPVWSADSQWLYFSAMSNGQWDLYRLNPDDSEAHNLTDTPHLDERLPRWLSGQDGLFYILDSEGQSVSMRMNLTDLESEPIAAELETAAQGIWSPGGQSVLATRLIDDNFEILKVAPPGDCQPEFRCPHLLQNIVSAQNLTRHPSMDREPVWSPMIDLPWKMWINGLAAIVLLMTALVPRYSAAS